ncbi:expressed unknown protein [Seminavis robusta]|uniref:AAA+ ATPase domain-containing protein n=1 Tax=Seminavis robusta TaxID=568900 RepID=A0A9N8HR25_9STRA|nr:expressed unknown protein [Seminavis robusta]|eukprot:Sro1220_g253540.1 n/a (977) ;mRNA; r:16054-19175
MSSSSMDTGDQEEEEVTAPTRVSISSEDGLKEKMAEAAKIATGSAEQDDNGDVTNTTDAVQEQLPSTADVEQSDTIAVATTTDADNTDPMDVANGGPDDDVEESNDLKHHIPSFASTSLITDEGDDDNNDNNDNALNDDKMEEDMGDVNAVMLTQAVDDDDEANNYDSSDDDSGEDDDDDDDASVQTSGSPAQANTPMEVRKARIDQKRAEAEQRKQGYERHLGLAFEINDQQQGQLTPSPRTPKEKENKIHYYQEQIPQGMCFQTPYNYYQHNADTKEKDDVDAQEKEIEFIQQLEQKYPYRQAQIRQLWSLLSPALPSDTATTRHNAPAPIFVTGPQGTGKTTLVRDMVAGLQQTRTCWTIGSRVGCAYVNCATAITMEEILHDAFRQLAADMKLGRQKSQETPRPKRKRPPKRATPVQMGFLERVAKMRRMMDQGEPDTAPDAVSNNQDAVAPTGKDAPDSPEPVPTAQHDNSDNSVEEKHATPGFLFQPRRSSRVRHWAEPNEASNVDKQQQQQQQVKPPPKMKKISKEASLDLKATAPSPSRGEEGLTSATIARTNVAAASFGQQVKESLFRHCDDCAFLILDEAERLLSLSTSSRQHYLSQLLLLPQTKGLNLTIIVITKSVALDHSRFDNSFSTLSSAIQPLKVHFQAYKGKEAFKQILAQPALIKRIIGPAMFASQSSGNDPFSQAVVKSFLNTLVQGLYGSIRDLKEMFRLGRTLWPKYMLPLHSSRLEQTTKSLHNLFPSLKNAPLSLESHWKQIVSFLDQQIRPHVKHCVQVSMYSLVGGSSDGPKSATRASHDKALSLSYLTRCLMVAAFICQTNKADKDKQVFTIQKNGKKNNANKKKSPGEDLAFGAAKSGLSKSYRPRMFPMERMLSVFVSIVGLNKENQKGANGSGSAGDIDVQPGHVGDTDFFQSLSNLRDIGVLHDRPSSSTTDVANMIAPRFWCSLTREEADVVARSVNFPLQHFLY